LDASLRWVVDGDDVNVDGQARGREAGVAVIVELEVVGVVVLAFSEGGNWARDEGDIHWDVVAITSALTNRDVQRNLSWVSLVIKLAAVKGDLLQALHVLAELHGALVLSAAQEVDTDWVVFWVKNWDGESQWLLLNGNTVNTFVLEAWLLVDMLDVDGDGVLVGEGSLVIRNLVAELAVVWLGGTESFP